MKRKLSSTCLAAVLLAAGFAASAADQPVTVPIKAQNGSGETGTATLTPQGDKTKVEVTLNGGPAAAQPAHIHEGSCAKLDPKPKYPLENVTGGKSSTVLPVSVSALTSGTYAINVHKSAEDLKTYVACGDIKG
jgi:hypothetical protein